MTQYKNMTYMKHIKLFENYKGTKKKSPREEHLIRSLSDNENFALIGGSESKRTLELVINELGTSNILVITTATAYKEDAEKKYINLFNTLGCNPDFIHASISDEVDTKENLNKLKNADTIFFTGGDQSRITKCYLGTLFLDEMRRRVSEGTPLIGTSAGAMSMSQDMIAGGDESPIMGKGLSMLPNIIIDTHFQERNRKPRLEMAVSDTINKIGIGISEDTAIVFKGKKVLTFGKGNIKMF